MSNGLKIVLSIGGIVLAGVLFKVLDPSGGGGDFSEDGVSHWCNACQEIVMVTVSEKVTYYEEHPERNGQPMGCPKCATGVLMDGQKCPAKGCFYRMAAQLPDGRPICPVCKEPLP